MGFRKNKLMRIMVIMVLVVGIFSITAFAAETGSVAIVVHDISDNTNTTVATYSRAQLNDDALFVTIDKYNYSSVTRAGVYQYYTAKGPELQEIFTKALTGTGIYLSDVGQIDIVGSDSYTFSTTKGSLLDTARSWYDEAQAWQDYVPAILATAVAYELDAADEDLFITHTLRDFYGQTSDDEVTANNLIKGTATIVLYVQ